MAYENPTIDRFKQFFVRDFPYGTDINTSVTDTDIGNAYQEVDVNINQALFGDQTNYQLGYLLLAAHFLVMSLQASSQGVSGQFNWMETSKSVGSVSQGFQIPQRILDNPMFALYSKTSYGARFLQLILPQLAGQVGIAYGTTRP